MDSTALLRETTRHLWLALGQYTTPSARQAAWAALRAVPEDAWAQLGLTEAWQDLLASIESACLPATSLPPQSHSPLEDAMHGPSTPAPVPWMHLSSDALQPWLEEHHEAMPILPETPPSPEADWLTRLTIAADARLTPPLPTREFARRLAWWSLGDPAGVEPLFNRPVYGGLVLQTYWEEVRRPDAMRWLPRALAQRWLTAHALDASPLQLLQDCWGWLEPMLNLQHAHPTDVQGYATLHQAMRLRLAQWIRQQEVVRPSAVRLLAETASALFLRRAALLDHELAWQEAEGLPQAAQTYFYLIANGTRPLQYELAVEAATTPMALAAWSRLGSADQQVVRQADELGGTAG